MMTRDCRCLTHLSIRKLKKNTTQLLAEALESSAGSRQRRHLQPITDEHTTVNFDANDFEAPCSRLPNNPNPTIWTELPPSDDGSIQVNLNFPFNFMGTTYTSVWINNNGNLSFDSSISTFTPIDFPVVGFKMIAPFWADVHTFGTSGKVWFRQTNSKLIVIWEKVGYFPFQNDKLSTFQVVISRREQNLSGLGNVCFCYADMDWTSGWASGGFPTGFFGAPATVGLNSGNGVDFVQFGRFDQPGMAYDGGYGANDGVDYLDNRLGLNAFCLDVSTPNVDPVFVGFPLEHVEIPCQTPFKILLTFLTPEPDQTVTVIPPAILPPGMTLVLGGTDTARTYLVEWTPQPGQGGDYELLFTANDSDGGTDKRNLLLRVADCTVEDKCEILPADSACDLFEPRPFCTPYRSIEYCPADESFPKLISDRYDVVKNNPAMILDDDYWFNYLEDKVAAYAFAATTDPTTINTPPLLCCVDSIDDLFSTCFTGASAPTNYFVIRAVGHHSGNGIFVLPMGFGGVELLRQTVYDQADVEADLYALMPTPTKIVVEKFLPHDSTAPYPTLPTEFKFHMFGDKVAAVSAIYHRGTSCPCYAEFDEEFNRLDTYGCFEPGLPEQMNGACHQIDFDAGAANVGPVKGFDICDDPLPDIPECVWNDMMYAAKTLGGLVGVYTRVDMFVHDNSFVYVQEFSHNHNGGLRHCWSRRHATGCIDSCFMGEYWKTHSIGGSALYGGPVTPVPSILTAWDYLTAPKQCEIATGVMIPPEPVSTC